MDRPFLVPETMRAHSLLSAMKKERKYFAVLLDEYGSVTRIVTLHDLVEELVGDLGNRGRKGGVGLRETAADLRKLLADPGIGSPGRGGGHP